VKYFCVLYVCTADSILTCSTDRDMRAVDQFGVRTKTKIERSSEKTRPTVNKVKVDQSLSRSLDTAAMKQARGLDTSAVKQAWLPLDGTLSGSSVVDVGRGDRQSLKQLPVDKVRHSSVSFLVLDLVLI